MFIIQIRQILGSEGGCCYINEMEKIKSFLAALVLLVALSQAPLPVLGQTEPIIPTETIQLFDGHDLQAFYTWLEDRGTDDPLQVFTVVDQIDGARAIRISGEEWGGLVTRNSYSRYHLVVEFRWGLVTWGERRNATRDSGILFHCQGPDGNTRSDLMGPWMKSIEAQIIQGGVGDFILVGGHDSAGNLTTPSVVAKASRDRDGEVIYDPEGESERFERGRINWAGRDPDWEDRLDFRGRHDVESPVDQWTRLEVIVADNTITNIVNGKVVNRVSNPDIAHGKILIQSEGAEIYFRKIELHPLGTVVPVPSQTQ